MKTLRIFVADDHPVVRAGLLGILAGDPMFEVVGSAADGAAAVERITASAPDVALLDLRMPELDGIEATRELARRGVATAVLILSTYETPADVAAALSAGARGYLLKDAPPAELFGAIRAIAAGKQVLAPRVAEKLSARRRDATEPLSAREVQVLGLAARGGSNKTIGAELQISEATVKTHMLHIFAKLRVDDRTAAVTRAVEHGYLRL